MDSDGWTISDPLRSLAPDAPKLGSVSDDNMPRNRDLLMVSPVWLLILSMPVLPPPPPPPPIVDGFDVRYSCGWEWELTKPRCPLIPVRKSIPFLAIWPCRSLQA